MLMAVRKRRPKRALIHSDPRHPVRQRWVAPLLPLSRSRAQHEPQKQIYRTRELAIADLADYIEAFDNRTRRRSHLSGLGPEQFEATHSIPS